MLSTRIFAETCRNFQRLILRNEEMQQNILNKTRNPLTQLQLSDMFAMTNLISQQLSQLQSEHVIGLLQKYYHTIKKINNDSCSHFENQISYDQKQHFFTINRTYHLHKPVPIINTLKQLKDLKQINASKQENQLKVAQSNSLPENLANSIEKISNEKDQLEVKIKIKNCRQQKLDQPSIRETLYFHELKDIDKYIKYSFHPKTPLFIQDMNRKKLEMRVLDKKNPYGFPLKAPPLIFDIELQNNVFITIKSTYEETNIMKVGKIKNNKKQYTISGMKLPRNLQKILFNDLISSSILNIDETQLLNIHKLAYLGGRVQKLNMLMNVHEVMHIENQSFFNQKFGIMS